MDLKDIKNKIKKSWNWVWHSDSILSWFVALILIYIIIKLILFPGLSLITGSSLPIAGVESSSMDHSPTKYCLLANQNSCEKYSDDYSLCGVKFNNKKSKNYWESCGSWYEEIGITKNEFSEFPLNNGFKKGDVIIIWNRFTPKIGDIIVFNTNAESSAPHPIIHRIISIEDGIIQTKGDHNEEQLTKNNNIYKTDETYITENQIIGKAVFKIPYLGWPKIILTDFLNKLFS